MSKLGLSFLALVISLLLEVMDLFRNGLTQSFLHESETERIIGQLIMWLVPITFLIFCYFLVQRIKLAAARKFPTRGTSLVLSVIAIGLAIFIALSVYYKASLLAFLCGLGLVLTIFWLMPSKVKST